MANIVVIENDPRVLKQLKQFLLELGGDDNKIRFFESQDEFEARYFNKANQQAQKSPLLELPSFQGWTSIQVDWLLDRKLESQAPYPNDSLAINMNVHTLKIDALVPEAPADGMTFGMKNSDLLASPNTLLNLIGTPFQPVFKENMKKAEAGTASEMTFPIASGDTGLFWLIHFEFHPNGESVLLKASNQTPQALPIFEQEAKLRSDQANEDGVELDLLACIDLVIFKFTLIKDFKKGWLKTTLKKLEQYGFRPPLRPTKFVMLKYEDDGVHKVDLLYPQLNDLIYLPLDRALFQQKIDVVLSQPEIVKPRFLFQQDTEMQINLSKRTMIEHISDVGIGIRNPMALREGILGHFFFSFPGEDTEHEVYGKVQKTIPHPEIEKQYIVYFTFVALDKNTLTDIRKFLSKNPRHHNLKNEDKEAFTFNPDNIFLTDEEKRIKNVVLVTPDSHTLQNTSRLISENFDQMRVMGTTSYQEFLKTNFANKSKNEKRVDLASVTPTSAADLGKHGSVMFFVNKDTLHIEAPMPPDENDTDMILGHRAAKLLALNNEWVSLLFPMKAEQEALEEAIGAAAKGRTINKTFVVFNGSMETQLVYFNITRSNADESIKIDITPADAKTLKDKILLEAPIGTLDALLIDSLFIPEDKESWIEGLTHQCQMNNLLPPDKQLKIIVLGSEDSELSAPDFDFPNFRTVILAPFDTRALLLNISVATKNNYCIYNFENMSWLEARMVVQIAKPVTLLKISEFGGSVASNSIIANGTFLFLRGDIFDNAPRRNLCARFYASEAVEDGPYKYQCHMLYFGINESFMKFARSWFRETYAASKQGSN